MLKLIYIRDKLTEEYIKREDILEKVFRFILSLLSLFMIQLMFPYDSIANQPIFYLIVSVIQAFLPLACLFYTGSALIAANLYMVSIDVMVAFLVICLIAMCLILWMDARHIFWIILTAVLFFLKVEYLIPVSAGIIFGFNALFPVLFGIVFYFMSSYVASAYVILMANTLETEEIGTGIQHIMTLMMTDRKLGVLLIIFAVVICLSAVLYRGFQENARLIVCVVGNAVMAVLLLVAKLTLILDYTVWRVLLLAILGIAVSFLVQMFTGLEDGSRIEKLVFEDEDYRYYVKAIPKIKVSQEEENIIEIKPDSEKPEADVTEQVDKKEKLENN